MNRTPLRLAGLALILSLLPFSACAGEAGCLFSGLPQDTLGICITQVPESGSLLLGSRTICPGDVLTAHQLRDLRFSEPESPVLPVLKYLPLTSRGVRPAAALSLEKKRNLPPEAEDCRLQTCQNLELTGTLKVRDPEGQALTFAITRNPRRGRVSLNPDGSFTYLPQPNKVGIDSFRFLAEDPEGNRSREATVTLEILKPSHMPQYVDTLGRDCRFAAEWMKHSGLFVGEILNGKPCFQPDRPITQGEFLTVLLKLLDMEPESDPALCREVSQAPLWLRPYLAAALRSGLTAGMKEALSPDQPLTAGDAAVLLQNARELPPMLLKASPAFRETAPLPAPEAMLTRGQAALVFYALSS